MECGANSLRLQSSLSGFCIKPSAVHNWEESFAMGIFLFFFGNNFTDKMLLVGSFEGLNWTA